MYFGYSTNAFVRFSLEEAIKKIAGLGFNGIEIMCDQPHLYPPDFDGEDLARIKELIDQYQLRVTNLNSFTLFAVGDTYLPSWIEPEKERREIRIKHTLQCLNLADTLGCPNISVPPGGPLKGMERGKAMSLFYQGLEKIIPVAEDLGIKVLVEPEPDLLLERTSEFKAFINGVKSAHVGLNFDMGHFFCAGEDPAVAFEELFEWVGHVHLEDIAATRVHNHLIAGQGAIDFQQIFETMRRLGYEGDMSLELYPYVDRPEEAAKESLNYLRPIFAKAGLGIHI
jgi:sugar phosphate isomerase/epimerase